VVVRIEGTNAPLGRKMLAESGLELVAAADLTDAARKVVAAARDAAPKAATAGRQSKKQ
jgi:succinyl-CoA synthetase beta subunit